MAEPSNIYAVVPVKEFARAKERLASALSRAAREALARAMLEDVLSALQAVRELAGILIVTADPAAMVVAQRYGAEVLSEGARDSHTAAVRTAGALLTRRNAAMLTVPGDIPLVTPPDIRDLIAARGAAPSFTIVPARDDQGSNAILCSPADAVPLRFGANSFFPHLATARAKGIEPRIIRLPHIELDVDTPDDLAMFYRIPSLTRTRALLKEQGFAAPRADTQMTRQLA